MYVCVAPPVCGGVVWPPCMWQAIDLSLRMFFPCMYLCAAVLMLWRKHYLFSSHILCVNVDVNNLLCASL